MLDSSGGIVGETRYYPFGETRETNGSMLTDRLFTGQREMAGLGIYHYGARFYSSTLGRFIQADTIVPNPGNPQSFNRFSYVYNNPIRYNDPSGHGVNCAIGESCSKADRTTDLRNWGSYYSSAIIKYNSPSPSTPATPKTTPPPKPTIRIVLSGSNGADLQAAGPLPEIQIPAWIDGANEVVQYSGGPLKKQAQANSVDINKYQNSNVVIIGYSAGADSSILLSDRLLKNGIGNITDVVILGGTFTSQVAGYPDLSEEWVRIFDTLLVKGTDILIIDDKAYYDNALGYTPPVEATGAFTYERRDIEHYQPGYPGNSTNNDPNLRKWVDDWIVSK